VDKTAYPQHYTGGENNGMGYSSGNAYPVEEAFGPESPFYPFTSGGRRLAGPPPVPGNAKRKKEVIL